MKKNSSGNRRFRSFPPRSGHIMHASAGIAQAAADLYFRLDGGNAAQWRDMFLDLRNLASS